MIFIHTKRLYFSVSILYGFFDVKLFGFGLHTRFTQTNKSMQMHASRRQHVALKRLVRENVER